MDIQFTVEHQIPKPPDEVFRAVADPKRLCTFFTKSASGPLEVGGRVRWTWHDGDETDVHVEEIVPPEHIVFTWKACDLDYGTHVTMSFEPDANDGTKIKVHESGWRDDEPGLQSSYAHCAGWQHMLMCLRARLLHGIDLR